MTRHHRKMPSRAPDGTGRPFDSVTHVVPAEDVGRKMIMPRVTLGSATTTGVGFTIAWQDTLHGPAGEARRGATVEEVLHACAERLADFQELSSFPCASNLEAISNIHLAISALNRRTLDRMERGVEGKNEE